MMTKCMELKEADLLMVSGGDYGDTKKDNNKMSSMYRTGKYVERYISEVHKCTKSEYIVSKAWNEAEQCWKYNIGTIANPTYIMADDIQRS